jgi:hypothetical protein
MPTHALQTEVDWEKDVCVRGAILRAAAIREEREEELANGIQIAS